MSDLPEYWTNENWGRRFHFPSGTVRVVGTARDEREMFDARRAQKERIRRATKQVRGAMAELADGWIPDWAKASE